jgi:WD40 repeat protein
VTSLAYSSDNLLIVTGSSDYNVRIWDAKTFKQKGEALIGHNDEITAVAISPDVKTIVSGSVDKTARIWDAQPGKKISN